VKYILQAGGKREVQYSDCKGNEPSSKDEEGTASKLEEKGKYSPQTKCDGDAVYRLEVGCTASRLEMRVHSLNVRGEGCTVARLEVREVQQHGTPTKRQVSKRQVSKRLVSKRPVSKRQVYKTSGLQNVRFQNVWFQNIWFQNVYRDKA